MLAADGDATSSPSERHVLLAVIAVTTAGVLPVFLFGGLAVQLRGDLALNDSTRGLVTFGYFAVSAALSIASGRLTERYGSRAVMRAAAITGVVSLLGIAGAHSLPFVFVALAFGGLSNALGQPAANALVVRTIAASRQGLALGVKQAAIPAATLLAGVAVPTVGLTVGWRWAFVGAAVLALASTFVVPSIGTEVRTGVRGVPTAERFAVGPLVVLGVGVGLGSAMANALAAFLTSSAVASGIAAGSAGLLLALGSALGLVMRVGSGWNADRGGGDHLARVAAMLVGGALGLAAIATGLPWLVMIGAFLAFGLGWSWPGVFNLAVVNHHPRSPAAATGFTQTGSYTGAAMGPLAMGALVQHRGYSIAWFAFSGIAVLAAVVMLAARRLLADG